MSDSDVWNTSIVVILKDEASYIDDWVIYHLALGIDHIFLLDNGSTDNIRDLLNKYIASGVLTYIYWPVRAGQVDGYNYVAKLLKGKSKWVGFLDVDEYVVLKTCESIFEFLESTGAEQILIPWRNFVYSGHRTKPGGTDLENYFLAHIRRPEMRVQVKHFVKTDLIHWVTAHFSEIVSGHTVFADGSATPITHAVVGPTYEGAQINHYATRSLQENVERMQKGQVDGGAEKQIAQFIEIDEETARQFEYDTSIMRHFTAFANERSRWRYVADRPHRYGALYRPSARRFWNNLPFYFCKSFANNLINAPKIQHDTQLDLMQIGDSGSERLLRTIWHGPDLKTLSFSIAQDLKSSFFMGSVHYADFVRRFDFECRVPIRGTQVNGKYAIETYVHQQIPFAYYDLVCSSPVKLTLELRDELLVSVDIPPGRFGGFLYNLQYISMQTVHVRVHGDCFARELVLGCLP